MNYTKILLVRLQYPKGFFVPEDIPRIRAYLSHVFPAYTPIHNHTPTGNYRYVYPEIQYKFLDGALNIVGHSIGAAILKEIFQQVDKVKIGHKLRNLPEKEIQIYQSRVGMAPEVYAYRFVTPWMALNQKNYYKILKRHVEDWHPFLERILWGNLRALAHGFNLWLENPEKIRVHGMFIKGQSVFKEKHVITFTGTFKTNFYIPPGLGIGKQVARGFGAVDADLNR
ncbi:MAG: hypothetical protein J7K63_02745 [Candidatus Marinimicrobia bacterium]|nr:hypothetical protein [Candidatus Neomarinimicrobiota bacterium]